MNINLELNKIKNNVIVRLLFLLIVAICSIILSSIIKIHFKIVNINIVTVLLFLIVIFFFFLFKQFNPKRFFLKKKLCKEIFFWSIVYFINQEFLGFICHKFIISKDSYEINLTNKILLHKNFFLIIFICFLAPFLEEVIFRGIIFNVFKHSHKITILIISSVLFASAHGIVEGIALLMSGSAFYFGYIYMKTNSLWNSIICHIINNSIVIIVMLFPKQIIPKISKPLSVPIHMLGYLIGLICLIACFYNYYRMYKDIIVDTSKVS